MSVPKTRLEKREAERLVEKKEKKAIEKEKKRIRKEKKKAKKKDKPKKPESSSSSDDSELDHQRIESIKAAILEEEAKRFAKL